MERSLIEALICCARENPQRIVFPEAQNETMLRAVLRAREEGVVLPVLAGDAFSINARAVEMGVDIDDIDIVDTADESFIDDVVERYVSQPGAIFGPKAARRRFRNPLNLAMALTLLGDAEAAFAGIETSTGDVLLAGQSIVGLEPGIAVASSFAIMESPDFGGEEGSLLAFGDSAVCENPNAEQLASIAISCCDSVRDLLGWEPRCALLSYSTMGSAEGELVEKVREASLLARQSRPDLAIDGEMQLDAAIMQDVAAKKATRESDVAGRANIVIWPDLNAGNIAVKCMQIFGRAKAYGPFLQGFRRIVSDCSRGASVDEIVGNIAVSSVRAAARASREGDAR